MTTVAKSFETYKEQVIPEEACEVQVSECRTAFYGGAVAMFHMMTYAADHESEDIAVSRIQVISDELDAFAASLPKE